MELLCAAVEFIHALWAGHQALAMEALKKEYACLFFLSVKKHWAKVGINTGLLIWNYNNI